MKNTLSILPALLSVLTTAVALPRPVPQYSSAPLCPVLPPQFYLVTTTSPICISNSSNLPNVSATSFFDPFQQAQFQLRLIGPGYLSIPLFNLTNGSVQAWNSDQFGQGNYTYSSEAPAVEGELLFDQVQAGETGGGGGLSWMGEGNLLAYNGSVDGWTICNGDVGQSVIEWMGSDESCVGTHLQGVGQPPY